MSWSTLSPIPLILCSMVGGRTDPNGIVRTTRWRLKKALRLFAIAEMANAAIIVCVLGLLSFFGLRGIISDPLDFFLDAFWPLSLCSLILVSSRYGVVPAGGNSKDMRIELLEAEVDASADKGEGMEYVVSYIRAHYKTPEALISLFLQHMALREDDAGKRARELLSESKSN